MFVSPEELNREQRAAVTHGAGPLLVLAGAGSGKTGTLACRVAHLIASGAEPSRICLLTFSRRAAQEMLARAGRLTNRTAAGRVWGGTFHAVANRVLRLHGRRLGLDPAFTVMDQGDTADLLGLVRHDLLATKEGTSAQGRRFPRAETLADVYSRTVNTQQALSAVLNRDFPWCADEADGVRAVFEAYTARKREQHLLDFDDLLVCWRALGAVPGGAELLARLWDHVLVDEYQDTNNLQADILAALRPDGTGVTVVGDDAQAIYAFRAATSRNLLNFPERFPGTTVVRLEHNYRSTPAILAVANAVMSAAGSGTCHTKTLWSARSGRRRPLLRTCEDEAAQAEAVCDSVLGHREDGVALRSQAVLFRAGHHADMVELALVRRNIPYVKYGGLKFLEAAHVKDLVASLRVLDNPWDELAWFRVFRLLEGVGPATARRLMADLGVRGGRGLRPAPAGGVEAGPLGGAGAGAAAGSLGGAGVGAGVGARAVGGAGGDPVVTPLARLLAASPRVPAAAIEELAGLRAALGDCADGCLPGGATPPPGVQVERLRRWLEPVVERRYDAAAPRIADLEQLQQAAARYGTRGRFVAELTLDPPASTGDLAGPPSLDDDWLVLSTVHSAKGGEWDVVHVLHVADGMFPSDMACGDPDGIEEERRLLYVAVTRARDVLELNVPFRYHHHRYGLSDTHSYGQVSRFLTAQVRTLMEGEHVGAPVPSEATMLDVGPADRLRAVDEFLSGLWQ
jgi:DNA helicase II / ATP-dependent DNA helicase PcrA